ncbi:protein phosphatase 1 regulatory subunit 3B-like [Stigmatopora argus]
MPTDMALPLFLPRGDVADLGGGGPAPRDAKKRVTFADHLGLPLARVKVFSRFKDAIRVPAGVQRLVPDFPQPANDDALFRQSLDRKCVRLEKCALSDRTLTGTVKVKNLSYEKRVALRVTFDAWESHSDVECVYADGDGRAFDTFAFRLELPPRRRAEFAVCYRVAGAEYWDSNRGRNYRLVPAGDQRGRGPEWPPEWPAEWPAERGDVGWRRLTCGRGLLPEWPAYAAFQNAGPYY